MSHTRPRGGFRDEWEHFRFGVDDGVATITLDRPERLNALTFDVYADLRDLFTELPQRDDLGAVVVTGAGRGFCSGGDVYEIIGELQAFGTRELLAFTRMTGAVVQRMRECPLPIVAAVNGVAAGAGAVIALASDFRILARSASLAFVFTKVGLAGADMGAAYLLLRLVGPARATELLVLGETLDAEGALRYGLATRVVDDAGLVEAVQALARRLADGPRLAQATTKLLLTREADLDLSAALELEAVAQALLMTGDDFREFYSAFAEKRPPRWTGR